MAAPTLPGQPGPANTETAHETTSPYTQGIDLGAIDAYRIMEAQQHASEPLGATAVDGTLGKHAKLDINDKIARFTFRRWHAITGATLLALAVVVPVGSALMSNESSNEPGISAEPNPGVSDGEAANERTRDQILASAPTFNNISESNKTEAAGVILREWGMKVGECYWGDKTQLPGIVDMENSQAKHIANMEKACSTVRDRNGKIQTIAVRYGAPFDTPETIPAKNIELVLGADGKPERLVIEDVPTNLYSEQLEILPGDTGPTAVPKTEALFEEGAVVDLTFNAQQEGADTTWLALLQDTSQR